MRMIGLDMDPHILESMFLIRDMIRHILQEVLRMRPFGKLELQAELHIDSSHYYKLPDRWQIPCGNLFGVDEFHQSLERTTLDNLY